MKCQKEENLKICPCTYSGCSRKGICCECIKYHLTNDELPACCFSKEAEKTYDRSIKKFIEDYKINNN
ncbi:MAG: cytosolic protein [Candidatus Pacebacteria bacterium]|nr:cytosolic protein [Candidatus Paceibacterota bacterium]